MPAAGVRLGVNRELRAWRRRGRHLDWLGAGGAGRGHGGGGGRQDHGGVRAGREGGGPGGDRVHALGGGRHLRQAKRITSG